MKNRNAQVTHSMLAWLREPNDIQQTELLNIALAEIRNIAGVTKVTFGYRIAEFGGPAGGFNYGWTITFENARAVDYYLNHPIHTKAAQMAMSKTERVIGGFYEEE